LFCLLALTAVACKGKPDAPAPAAGSAAPAGSNTPVPPPAKAIPNEPPIAVGSGAPADCAAYKDAIDKLMNCTALDVQTRAKLRHEYNESATKWNAMGSADKAGLAQQCKDGLAAVNAAAKTPCKW